MINQITQNDSNKSVFAPLQSSGAPYAIIKPFTETQKIEVKKEEEKKENKLGYKIAKIALITGFGIFALMKGAPRGIRNRLNNLLNRLEEKTIQMGENKNLSGFQIFYLRVLKKTKSLANKSKALFNTAPLKDVLVMKSLKKFPKLKKIGDHITNLFEKISVKTSKRAYSRTLVQFDEMYANFAEANKKMPSLKVKQIEEKISHIQKTYKKAFSEKARNERLNEMKSMLDGIDEKIWDETYRHPGKLITSKRIRTTFISEELAAEAKMKLHNDVNKQRLKITNSIDDNYNATNKLLKQINTFVDPGDQESRVLIQKILNTLKEYKKSVDAGKKEKNLLLNKDFSKKLDELDLHISKFGKYDTSTTEGVSKGIQNLKEVLRENKKGEIQQILEIYKGVLPEKDYIKLKKSTYKTIDSFNKSIDLETDKLFDKIRDLKIGSAPTDVVGVLSSIGVIGWGLSKADNKDERISVAIKYGVPTVGALLISLYCTLGLVSGGTSIIVGLISGIAINKLGVYLDKKRKQYQEKPLSLPNPNTIIPKLKEKAKSI